MELILKHPTIKSFLLGFNREEYTPTIKQLILIGIDTVLARFKGTSHKQIKAALTEWTKPNKPLKPAKQQGTIVRQIEEIKEELLKINEKFESVRESKREPSSDGTKQKAPLVSIVEANQSSYQAVQKDEPRREAERRKSTVTPKVTEVCPDLEQSQPFRKPDRRWLDDTQSRMALTYQDQPIKSQGKVVKFGEPSASRQTRPISQNNTQSLGSSQALRPNEFNPARAQTYETVASEVFKTEQDRYRTVTGSKSGSHIKSTAKPLPPTTYTTNNSQRAAEIEPKYLKKVQSKIKNLIRQDKLRSKVSHEHNKNGSREAHGSKQPKENARDAVNRQDKDFTYKAYGERESKNHGIRHQQLSEQSDQSFSPYKQQPQSNIVIANKFLSSELAMQFSQANLSDDGSSGDEHRIEEQSKEEDSQFSVFSPNFTEESAASFRNPQQRHKEVGKISRRNE